MAFNLMGGMQALANFGTGYMQEGRNEQQDAYNKVATQSAQLDLQQKQLQAKQAQQMSDDAIKMSIQQGQQAGKPPQQGQQGQQPPQQMDPVQQMSALAAKELGRGNITGAGQLQAQAANLANAQMAQQEKQATIQSTTLKASIQGLQYASQLFSTVTDDQSYQHAKMQMLSNPMIPAEGRAAIANLPDHYDPRIVAHLVNSGMSVAQQKTQQLRQMEFQSAQQSRSLRDSLAIQHEKLYAAKTAADIAHQGVQRKAGATAAKPVTTMDLAQAQSAIKENLFSGQEVPPEDKELVNRMTQDVAAASKQILVQHPGMDAATAMYQAIQQVKDTGQFQTTTTNTPTFRHPISGVDTTTHSYQAKGISKDNPIEVNHKMSSSDMQEGRYYKVGGKVYQDVGGKPVLVQ